MNAFTEYFNVVTRHCEDPHLLLTLDGIIVAVNSSAAVLLKYNETDLQHTGIKNFLSDTETSRKYLKSIARTSTPVPAKLDWLAKDGERIRLRTYGYRIHLKSYPEKDNYLLIRVVPKDKAYDKFLALNRMLEEVKTSKNNLFAKSKLLEDEIAAHHKTEATLEVANTGLEAILNSLESIVYVADMQTYELIFINSFAKNIFGEVTGKICWEAIQTGQKGPCVFCTNKYLLDSDGNPGPTYVWEFQNTISGRWYYIQDKAIRWVDGRLVRIEIATDITERKLLEASLRLNEERLKALWRLNQLKDVSEKELADYALEEAVKLTRSAGGYFHHYSEEEKSIHLSYWSRKVLEVCESAEGSHYPLEKAGLWADCIRLRRPVVHNDYQNNPDRKGYPEGHFRVIRHISVPVFDHDKIVAVAGVANKKVPYDDADVRQLSLFMNNIWSVLKQKRTELEVLRAKEEWESTFDAIDEVVTIHDREMKIIRANRTAGFLFQTDPEQLTGRHCYEIFGGISKPCEGCPEVLTLKNNKTYRADIHHENLGKTFEVSSSPIVNDENELTGIIHIAKDITEQKKLEEQLRQAQKMEAIGTLAGGIAHDFNNILAPILGYADLALEQVSPTSQIYSEISQIVKAANRAKDLVKQILSFSRQGGREMQPLEIHLVIKEALRLLRHSIPSTIEIKQNIPACGNIMGDSTQLQQIIMNLGTNAYHAMRETGGTLTANLAKVEIDEKNSLFVGKELRPGSYVKLEISDTGHGMDRETMEKVFEPYFTTKPKGEGTGLGLAVVHGLVKSHHGYITVHSEPGQGTTFRVYFPQCPAKEVFLKSPASSLPKGHERILVLDDEVAIVELETSILTRLGYKVSGYSDCEEALAEFRSSPENFDLIITDMTMPQKTGLQMTYESHAIRPDIPVILCTGFSELVDEEKAGEAGIKKYLMKPMSRSDLAHAVREALDGEG